MSSVIINKTTSDVVDIELVQSGSHTISTVLRDSLLDGSKDYSFAAVHLSVPLEATPMFPLKSEFELFTIHRRNAGISQTTDLTDYLAFINETITATQSSACWPVVAWLRRW